MAFGMDGWRLGMEKQRAVFTVLECMARRRIVNPNSGHKIGFPAIEVGVSWSVKTGDD